MCGQNLTAECVPMPSGPLTAAMENDLCMYRQPEFAIERQWQIDDLSDETFNRTTANSQKMVGSLN
jgi:hypothetical protein